MEGGVGGGGGGSTDAAGVDGSMVRGGDVAGATACVPFGGLSVDLPGLSQPTITQCHTIDRILNHKRPGKVRENRENIAK